MKAHVLRCLSASFPPLESRPNRVVSRSSSKKKSVDDDDNSFTKKVCRNSRHAGRKDQLPAYWELAVRSYLYTHVVALSGAHVLEYLSSINLRPPESMTE